MARDMTRGSEAKILLGFALPIFAGNVLQQLYNTVDTMVVGRFVSQQALSAVGTCTSLTMLFVAIAMGMSTGCGVIIAQYFGAKNFSDLRRSLSTSIIMLSAFGLLLTLVAIAGSTYLLSAILNVPDTLLPQARTYFNIYALGLVFQFVYNGVAAALRSVGDSRATLLFLFISSVLNIALDLLFVISFGWGVAGTAVATVVSQGVSAVVSLIYMWKRYDYMRFKRREFVFDRDKFKLALKLGVPTTIQMCIASGGQVLVQRVVNGFGESAIAGFTAAGRIENYLYTPCQAMNAAMATFTGQNIGAGTTERISTGLKKALLITVPFIVVISLLANIFASQLNGLFGLDAEALELANSHLRFLSWFFFMFGIYMPTGGVINGSGDVVVSAAITLSSLATRVICTYLFAYVFHLGFASLYISIPIGWMFSLISMILRYSSKRWLDKAIVKREGPTEEPA